MGLDGYNVVDVDWIFIRISVFGFLCTTQSTFQDLPGRWYSTPNPFLERPAVCRVRMAWPRIFAEEQTVVHRRTSITVAILSVACPPIFVSKCT